MSHRRHNTTVMEPLDLPQRRSYPLAPPPARSSPGMRRAPQRRRRGVIRSTGHGGILMARNLSVFVVLLILAAVFGLWLFFSYAAPALLDKLDKPPGELFSTTTTAP